MRSEPDGMLGAVIASESLGLTDTMINGAGGCRSRTQIMMHELIPTYSKENMDCCRSKNFSQQSKLPCTYLNNDDIVFGTSEKIASSIDSVSEITGKRVVLLDTLGASLICTDYGRLVLTGGVKPITIEDDLSSLSLAEGYDLVVSKILSVSDISSGNDGSVNILGYGLVDMGWKEGSGQMVSLLESMGIKVNCVLGCMPSEESIKSLGNASLNILIHPEYCRKTAESLKERFGTPYLRLSEGAPIGYPAIRSFVTEVANALGKDPAPALKIIDEDAQAVHSVLMQYDRIPRGFHVRGFTIEGDSSTVMPIVKWVMTTFGMIPRKITLFDDEYRTELESFLKSHNLAHAMEEGIDGEVEIVFTDGLTALEGRLSRSEIGFVEIRIPWGRQIDLMGRTMAGPKGCRYLLDEMINSLMRFRCGQPTDLQFR